MTIQIIDLTTRRTTTDISGQIATGGVSQLVTPANPQRYYLYIQNPSTATESLFVNEGGPASTVADNCWELLPGGNMEYDGSSIIFIGDINITAATTGHAFIAKEA
jgi:hypothetical protein